MNLRFPESLNLAALTSLLDLFKNQYLVLSF